MPSMLSGHNHFELEGYFANIPIDQSGTGRHKCPGCAFISCYYLGYSDLPFELEKIIDYLPTDQSIPQRHLDAKIAATSGYSLGRYDRIKHNPPKFSPESIKGFITIEFYNYLYNLCKNNTIM